jgi:hypothetical protein
LLCVLLQWGEKKIKAGFDMSDRTVPLLARTAGLTEV